MYKQTCEPETLIECPDQFEIERYIMRKMLTEFNAKIILDIVKPLPANPKLSTEIFAQSLFFKFSKSTEKAKTLEAGSCHFNFYL